MHNNGCLLLILLSTFILGVIEARQIENVVLATTESLTSNEGKGRGKGVTVYGDCAIDVNEDLSNLAPIITPAGQLDWLETNNQGIGQINNGDWIDMYCENSFAAPFNNVTLLQAQCLQGIYFLVNGKIYEFNKFSCTSWPTYVARRTGRPCNNGTDLLKVGYELKDVGFLQVMDICHDEVQQTSRYSYYQMNPGNAKHQSGVSRPSFAQKDFYGDKNVNTLYTQARQKTTFANILQKDVSMYFDSNNVYLARGHLAAKADFVYAPEQRATFLFVNVAPQWQSFNGANWERVESSVRDFVGAQNLYVDCYTGIWDVMTLPDVSNTQKQIYLDFDENGNGLIPVPKIYYRIIIDQKTQYGIVLLGVNNPHATLEEIERDYLLCPDISDKLDWVDWDKRDLKKGYSYACSVPSFLQKVDDLPAQVYNVKGVLSVDKPAEVATFL